MRRALATLAMAATLAACAHVRMHEPRMHESRMHESRMDEASVHEVEAIPLPRPLKAGEQVLLQVELGILASGGQIVLRTPDGRLIGAVSPHGIRHGAAAGTYLLPLSDQMLDAVLRDGRLRLRMSVEPANAAARPANAEAVRAVRAVIVSD